jgi:hypothetical protein
MYDWNGQPWDKPYPGPDALQNDPGLAQNGLLIACRSYGAIELPPTATESGCRFSWPNIDPVRR